MHKRRKWTVTLAAAVAAALLGSGPAWAATTPTEVRSAAGVAKCVGLADNGSTVNGTRLVIWDCHGHNDQWWYTGDNSSLRSSASGWPQGKCVGLANNGSTLNGTELVLWDCHGHNDQIWAWESWANGNRALVNTPSGKCVGLANNGSTDNGTRLVLWDCHGHADQQWFFVS